MLRPVLWIWMGKGVITCIRFVTRTFIRAIFPSYKEQEAWKLHVWYLESVQHFCAIPRHIEMTSS